MFRKMFAALLVSSLAACATATPAAQQPARSSLDQRFGDAFADVENEEDRKECRDRGLPSNCNDKQ